MNIQQLKNQLLNEGFVVINNIFNKEEIDKILETIPTTATKIQPLEVRRIYLPSVIF